MRTVGINPEIPPAACDQFDHNCTGLAVAVAHGDARMVPLASGAAHIGSTNGQSTSVASATPSSCAALGAADIAEVAAVSPADGGELGTESGGDVAAEADGVHADCCPGVATGTTAGGCV